MIPTLVEYFNSPWALLPPGVHWASLDEVETAFATNDKRRRIYAGFVDGCGRLRIAGCRTVWVDGSFVSAKPRPRDFDACWDPTGVDPTILDPVFLQFADGRAAQKAKFKGEFFPSSMTCIDVGATFLEFFQQEHFTGKRKGIIGISLSADPRLSGKVQP
jgi:hypothetical protein